MRNDKNMSNKFWSNEGRNYSSLEKIPASSLQPKLLLWDSYEKPCVNKPSGTPVQRYSRPIMTVDQHFIAELVY